MVNTADKLNQLCENSLVAHLGIEITRLEKHRVDGKMPVDHRTRQPFGLLHGGASLVLAETLASIGAMQAVDGDKYDCIGLDINANHLKSVSKGHVYGKASAIHLGFSTHVWQVEILDDQQRLVCISRVTLSIVAKN